MTRPPECVPESAYGCARVRLPLPEGSAVMPPHAQGHPSWCEYPLAPDDSTHTHTHTHTAAIGTAHLAADATAELALVQEPGAVGPTLTLHVVTLTARLSIDMTGTQAWALAGVLIDATVAHAHAAPNR